MDSGLGGIDVVVAIAKEDVGGSVERRVRRWRAGFEGSETAYWNLLDH